MYETHPKNIGILDISIFWSLCGPMASLSVLRWWLLKFEKQKRKRLPARQHTSPLVGHDVYSFQSSCHVFFSVVFCQATIVLTPSFGNLEWDIFSEMLQMTVMWLDLQKTRFVFLRTLGFPSWFHMEMAGLPDCHPWKPWGEGPAHRDQATGEWQGHFGTRADAGDLEWWSHKWRESVEVFGRSQYYIIIYIENSLRNLDGSMDLGFGSRHLQPKAKLVLIGKFLVWRIENIDFHLVLLCLKWMIFPHVFWNERFSTLLATPPSPCRTSWSSRA